MYTLLHTNRSPHAFLIESPFKSLESGEFWYATKETLYFFSALYGFCDDAPSIINFIIKSLFKNAPPL